MSSKLAFCFLPARLRGTRLLRPCVSFSDPRRYSTAAGAAATGAAAAAAAAGESAPRPIVLMASSTDIAFNLATEAFLKDTFTGLPKQGRGAPSESSGGGAPPSSRGPPASEKRARPLLFLWRNDKTIVIGRHQNAWKECAVAQMQAEDVKLARRYSGGGAVYQDLGNTCFTIFSSDLKREECSQIVIDALKSGFGIEAVQSGRNDLVTADGRKFSGSAYVKAPNGWIHHGTPAAAAAARAAAARAAEAAAAARTAAAARAAAAAAAGGDCCSFCVLAGTLMREVDCKALGRLLTPNAAKLKSKGVSSVESRVVNLKEICPSITHESLCEALRESFLRHLKVNSDVVPVEKAEGFKIDDIPLAAHPGFYEYLEVLNSWNWIYGKSPKFSSSFETRFDWGSVEVGVVVVDGTIKDCRVFSDALLEPRIPQPSCTANSRHCGLTSLATRRKSMSLPSGWRKPLNPEELGKRP
ncbi:hypothetical protein Emed_000076 [Eimeria media]